MERHYGEPAMVYYSGWDDLKQILALAVSLPPGRS
jgi:hypothetical protein